MDPTRRILATSGGFLPGRGGVGWQAGPLLRHALALTGAQRPRVCYVGTAGADDPGRYAAFYSAWDGLDVRLTHLALFPWPSAPDVTAHLLDCDLVWVGGGNTANLLALWRVHGVDAAMRAAWEAGVLLGGVSAGSLCWHAGGTTDSFGPELAVIADGLGLLPYSNCPHYDSEERRRPLYHRLVGSGALPAGWATDDGVGLLFEGTELTDVLADRPGAAAWRVEPDHRGGSHETRVAPRLLSDP